MGSESKESKLMYFYKIGYHTQEERADIDLMHTKKFNHEEWLALLTTAAVKCAQEYLNENYQDLETWVNKNDAARGWFEIDKETHNDKQPYFKTILGAIRDLNFKDIYERVAAELCSSQGFVKVGYVFETSLSQDEELFEDVTHNGLLTETLLGQALKKKLKQNLTIPQFTMRPLTPEIAKMIKEHKEKKRDLQDEWYTERYGA